MKRGFVLAVLAVLVAASPSYAVPFTWTISGVADAGSHLDASTDIGGLATCFG